MAPKNKNAAAAAAARTASPAPAVASSSSFSSSTTPATTTSTPAQQVSAVTSVPSISSSVPTNKPSSSTSSSKAAANQSWDKVIQNLTKHYLDTTPQRTKLIDAFQVFLVAVGALQFLYCILAGNYPFNAFLSGFSATVGQFVLTASLRIQTTESNKKEFPAVSPERAFADYVVCSLILHFFCVNFIN